MCRYPKEISEAQIDGLTCARHGKTPAVFTEPRAEPKPPTAARCSAPHLSTYYTVATESSATAAAYQTTNRVTAVNAFVTKINLTGTALMHST
jgi:hypothetical protein